MENDPESIYLIKILMIQLNTVQQMKDDLIENFPNSLSNLVKQQEESFSKQIHDISERISKLGKTIE